VRNTILVHDLGTTKLKVGGVNLATEQLVNGRGTSEDDGLALNLNGTLAETHKVSTDTDRAAGNEGDGEDVLVSLGGGTGNETGTLQTLDTKTVLGTNDSGDLVTVLTLIVDELGDDLLLLAGIKALLNLGSEVKVLETGLGLLRVVPGNREEGDNLIGNTDAGTRVGRQVDTRNTQLAGKLGTLVEELVFLRTEGTNLEGDVVGDDDETSAAGVLGSTGSDDPTNHTVSVGTRLARHLNKVVGVIQNQLAVVNALSNRRALLVQGRNLLGNLGPAVLEGLAEKLGEIVHVLSSHQVSLVTLGLQPFLSRVRGRHGAHVHGAELGGTTNALEDPLALLGLALDVQLDVDDETVGVADNHTQRVGHTGSGVGAKNTDLCASNPEAPQAAAEAIEETGQGLLDIDGLEVEDGREVNEDVVQIRVVVANDLQGVQDVVHETVSLRDQVLSGGDIITQTAGTNHGTNEVALVNSLVVLGTLADSFVNVNVAVLGEDGLDVELGKTAKLQLEGKSGLAVTDTQILLVVGATESEVTRIDTLLAADEGNTTNTTSEELILVVSEQLFHLFNKLGIFHVLNIANGNVADSSELAVTHGLRGGATLAFEASNETLLAGTLGVGATEREDLKSLGEELLSILQVLHGDDNTLADGVTGGVAHEEGHVADGVDPLKGVGLRNWSARGGGLGGVENTELTLAELAKGEVPRQEGLLSGGVVFDTFESVCTVGTANINFQGGEGNPRVSVDEEARKNIEDGVLRVDNLLQDLQGRLTVLPSGLTVARLDNGRPQNVLHLGQALIQRWHSALNKNLTGLEGNLSGRTRLELGQLLENGLEVRANVLDKGLVGAVHVQNSQDQVVLRTNAAMREDSVDNAGDVVLVLLAELENNILVAEVMGGKQLLNVVVLFKQANEDIVLVGLRNHPSTC
jgi:hypothetical protein